jgi:UDP-N-acetylglucosamine 4,6-dehydratase
LAAIAAGCNTVVGISTDKACSPANTYGMTKALMERMYGELDHRSTHTRFVTARYGNVVGSTGSVIPVFRQQIRDNKQLRVTDSRMTRFWLSVDEAINLINWAVGMSSGNGGHTFIPKCSAMSIDDIAKLVWEQEMSNTEYDIIYTGIRPGEKLHEALFNEQEAPRVLSTAAGFIMRPAIEQPWKTVPDRMEYESSHPDQWMKKEHMAALIEDAKDI